MAEETEKVWNHMCSDVAGILRNRRFRGFTDKDGKALSAKAVEAQLRELLASGVKFIPLGDCDNFDSETGCRGHRG